MPAAGQLFGSLITANGQNNLSNLFRRMTACHRHTATGDVDTCQLCWCCLLGTLRKRRSGNRGCCLGCISSLDGAGVKQDCGGLALVCGGLALLACRVAFRVPEGRWCLAIAIDVHLLLVLSTASLWGVSNAKIRIPI